MASKRSKKKDTTSSAPSTEQPQDVVAGQGVEDQVQSATSTPPTQERKKHMAEQDELGSIIEYSEDLADAEAPEPLPPGDGYEAQLTKAEAKISNASGKKYAAVTFYIPIDQFPPDYPVEQNPDGVSIIYRMVPLEDNPRARFQCKRFIQAIGAVPGKRIDLNDWIGLIARVGIQNEDYEGIPREVITKVSPA